MNAERALDSDKIFALCEGCMTNLRPSNLPECFMIRMLANAYPRISTPGERGLNSYAFETLKIMKTECQRYEVMSSVVERLIQGDRNTFNQLGLEPPSDGHKKSPD